MKLPIAIVALTACVWSAPSAAQKCVGLLDVPSATTSERDQGIHQELRRNAAALWVGESRSEPRYQSRKDRRPKAGTRQAFGPEEGAG